MDKFIFKPFKSGYLMVRGNGRVIFFTLEQMKIIHPFCHEAEEKLIRRTDEVTGNV